MYLKFVIAFLLVLSLIGLLAFFMRYGKKRFEEKEGKTLKVGEICAIDPKNRLVVIRWHGVEYLILMGGPQGAIVIDKSPVKNHSHLAIEDDK